MFYPLDFASNNKKKLCSEISGCSYKGLVKLVDWLPSPAPLLCEFFLFFEGWVLALLLFCGCVLKMSDIYSVFGVFRGEKLLFFASTATRRLLIWGRFCHAIFALYLHLFCSIYSQSVNLIG